jgi:hypothetical protein
MKKILGKKNRNYIQGIFTPKNREKYKGSLPIIFRSRLEMLCFRWMDNNPNIISWGSESIVIPYTSPKDGKMHRYFVDLVVHLKDKQGNIKKLLIEVKPEKQTKPPTESKKKKQSTIIYEKISYAVNLAKWQAAKSWAASKGYTFLIINEKHLNLNTTSSK